MKTLNFSDQQVTQIVSDLQRSKGDYSQLMKIFLEAMMCKYIGPIKKSFRCIPLMASLY